MTRPDTRDHAAKIDSGKRKEVGLAVIHYGKAGDDREYAACSCGWVGYHSRLKVLEDRIDQHLNRRHNGRGIRV